MDGAGLSRTYGDQDAVKVLGGGEGTTRLLRLSSKELLQTPQARHLQNVDVVFVAESLDQKS